MLGAGILDCEFLKTALQELFQENLDGSGNSAVDFDPAFVKLLDSSGSHASGDDHIDSFSDECAHRLTHAVGVVLIRVVDDFESIFVRITNSEIWCTSEMFINLGGLSVLGCGGYANLHEFLLCATKIWWLGDDNTGYFLLIFIMFLFP